MAQHFLEGCEEYGVKVMVKALVLELGSTSKFCAKRTLRRAIYKTFRGII